MPVTPSPHRKPSPARRIARSLTATALAGVVGLACWQTAHGDPLPVTEPDTHGALLANPGFDAADQARHPINWNITTSGGASAQVVNRRADHTQGPWGLEVVDTASGSVGVRSEKVVAVPGGEYTLSAKVRTGTGEPAWLYLEFWDFNGKRIAEQVVKPTASPEWQTLTVKGVAPTAETSSTKLPAAHVTALVYGSQAAAGTSFWDEVKLDLAPRAYDPVLKGRELFLDDYRIESAHHVGRVVHPAEVTGPVLSPDKPWEQSSYIYGSVHNVDGRLRMFYMCYNDQLPNYFLCLAESRDGKRWDKPKLGLVGYGSIPASETNIVLAGGGTVAYNPTAPADRRYLLMNFQQGTVNDTMGYYVRFSGDGLHWTDPTPKPQLLDGDVSNVTWDPVGQQYIATIKKRMFTARTDGYERSAFLATSKDGLTWTEPYLAVSGDYADDGKAESIGGLESQIYGMPVARYESTYLGLPWVFALTDFTTGEYKQAADGPIDVQLASSRDLTRWTRPVRDPLIRPGLPGAWDDGAHYTASNLQVDDRSIRLYFGAFNNGHGGAEPGNPDRETHAGQVGLATWRRDGFVSLTNGATPGTGGSIGQVTTKPITVTGRDLHLNADVRPRGEVTVEVLDAQGNPVPGMRKETVRGDRPDAKLGFGRSWDQLRGQQVKLRFTVANADLYSYWME